jgi:enolase-phosphatase E1
MIKAIVTDIEGTTSSIGFVHDVLFPYARTRMREFVRKHAADAEVAQQLDAVRKTCNAQLDVEGVIQELLSWIEQDKKVTPLKALQGMIWEEGYRAGDFLGDIYADAYENLTKWHEQGIALYVYSSGSAHAQKLLFGHTRYGDLTPLFRGYFDTRIGAKGETASYLHIVQALQLPAEHILFLSDIETELDAARAAGLKTCWLVRDTQPKAGSSHPQAHDFNAINITTF